MMAVSGPTRGASAGADRLTRKTGTGGEYDRL